MYVSDNSSKSVSLNCIWAKYYDSKRKLVSVLKKSFSAVLVKWRRSYRGTEGERSHFNAELY